MESSSYIIADAQRYGVPAPMVQLLRTWVSELQHREAPGVEELLAATGDADAEGAAMEEEGSAEEAAEDPGQLPEEQLQLLEQHTPLPPASAPRLLGTDAFNDPTVLTSQHVHTWEPPPCSAAHTAQLKRIRKLFPWTLVVMKHSQVAEEASERAGRQPAAPSCLLFAVSLYTCPIFGGEIPMRVLHACDSFLYPNPPEPGRW
jgi:hypothetical protein